MPELTHRRTHRTTTYLNPDNTLTERSWLSNRFYKPRGGDGSYVEIDATWKPSSAALWDWQMVENRWRAYLDKFGWLMVQHDDVETQYRVKGIASYNKAANRNTMLWRAGYRPENFSVAGNVAAISFGNGITLTFTLRNDAIKEELLIPQALRAEWMPMVEDELAIIYELYNPPDTTFTEDGGIFGVDRTETSLSLILRNGNMVEKLRIPVAEAYSPNGNRNDAENKSILAKRTTIVDGEISVLMGLTKNALRTWPDGDILFDPTVGVAAGGDDGYWTTSTFNNSANELRFGDISTTNYNSFMRFQLNVPNAATIDSADIDFVKNTATGTASVFAKIWAEDADNPAAPTTFGDANGRTLTTASVQWTLDQTQASYTTPEIKTVVQEVVDRAGWVANNYIQIMIKDDTSFNSKCAQPHSYESTGGTEPTLNVTYTAAPPDPSNVTATAKTGTNTTVTVGWTDNSDNETGFRVRYDTVTAPSGWTTFGTTAAADATSLDITGLSAVTNYKFEVQAFNAIGDSAWVGTPTAWTKGRVRVDTDDQNGANAARDIFIISEDADTLLLATTTAGTGTESFYVDCQDSLVTVVHESDGASESGDMVQHYQPD